jgi:hypothetical protein
MMQSGAPGAGIGAGVAGAVVAGPEGAGAIGAAVIVDGRPEDAEVFRYDPAMR